VGARVEKVGRCRSKIKIEALVGIRREKADGFVLKNQITDAIENRFAFVNFDTEREVRTVGDENIGALVDHMMGKFGHELSTLFKLGASACGQQTRAAEFMTVDACNDPVRLATRFANPTQIIFEIALIGLSADGKSFAGDVAIAEQV